MSKYIVQNGGTFYVQGKGFATLFKSTATQLTSAEADGVINCAKNMGQGGAIKVQLNKSFAVFYIRPEDILGEGVRPNSKSPSSKRFATREEANTHGARFADRVKRGTDTPVGHIGFYVKESTDAVNAYVNAETGLTNNL